MNLARNIDVQRYTIDATINPRTQSIEATAKIDFTPLENANQATFELNNALTISKAADAKGAVSPPSAKLRFFSPCHVSLRFDQRISPVSFSLSYDGKLTGNEDCPISGITFAALHPDYGYCFIPRAGFP